MTELLFTLGGIIAALAGAFWFGKSNQKHAQNKQDLDAIRKAKEVENEIDKMDDATVRDRAAKWVRSKR